MLLKKIPGEKFPYLVAVLPERLPVSRAPLPEGPNFAALRGPNGALILGPRGPGPP